MLTSEGGYWQPAASGNSFPWPRTFKRSDPASFPLTIQSTQPFQQFSSKNAMRGYSKGQDQVKTQLAHVATKEILIRQKENSTSQWVAQWDSGTSCPWRCPQHSDPRPWATWSARALFQWRDGSDGWEAPRQVPSKLNYSMIYSVVYVLIHRCAGDFQHHLWPCVEGCFVP